MKFLTAILLIVLSAVTAGKAEQVLTLDMFLQVALEKDTNFEQILLDEMKLQYRETLALPVEDLVLSVKESVGFLLDADHDLDTTVSLSKLFPRVGTEVRAEYRVQEGPDEPSSVAFSIAQPIAENAFGRSTRLLEKITGLEVDVARHQVVEAYEDYLALLTRAYYRWYAAYLEREVGRSSSIENQKLLENILDREKSQVALPIDVSKIRLQVLGKQGTLVELDEQYASARDLIMRSIRHDGAEDWVPAEPSGLELPAEGFSDLYKTFRKESRTFAVLDLLEAKSDLQVDRDADALLPSLDLVIGVEVDGRDYGLDEDEQKVVAGIVLEWPLPGTQEKARSEVSKIERDQARLDTGNAYHDLYADLQSLFRQVKRERRLLEIADERISLARSVLEAETENYSFGKVTLNDYISAVNSLDNQRFARIRSDRILRELILEWHRLTDQWVTELP